jgi:hypothetical protein
VLDVLDVMDYLVHDESTRCLCLIVDSLSRHGITGVDALIVVTDEAAG